MISLTCYHLGRAYGALGHWLLCLLLFMQSASLTRSAGDSKGYGMSLFNLGIANSKLGEKAWARDYLELAVSTLRQASPEDSTSAEKALRQLSDSG